MLYPVEILPHPKRKLISCDVSDLWLAHFTTNADISKYGPLVDANGLINSNHIANPSARMDDLSMNLLGVFTEIHSKIEILKPAQEYYNVYCKPDDLVKKPLSPQDFKQNDDRVNWFVQIQKFNKYVCDFKMGEKQTDFKAICEITHTPMRWNFWHFSIRWYIEGKGYLHEMEEKDRKKYASKIGKDTKGVLAKVAKSECVAPRVLHLSDYCLKLYSLRYLQNMGKLCYNKHMRKTI